MTIVVNGESREMDEGSTVLDLVQSMGLEAERVVAERNGEILGRDGFGACALAEGDRLELVRFVGGG